MDVQLSAEGADPQHLQPLIDIGRAAYPPDSPLLSESYLRWLYLENPAGTATLILARYGEVLIGVIALIPIDLEAAGRITPASIAVNVLTHPEHRGKHAFGKMIKRARAVLSAEGRWLIGHPNAAATPGWTRARMTFREPRRIYMAKLRAPFSPRRVRSVDAAALHRIPDEFWGRVSRRAELHTRYTPQFLEWRFLRAPHKRYDVAAVSRRGQLIGLRVTAPFRRGVAWMIDYVAPTADLARVVSTTRRPTLVIDPGRGVAGQIVRGACWKLPVRREMPFFATTWVSEAELDTSGITFAASDA